MFSGKSVDAESTILPAVTSWVAEAFAEIPEARSYEDHGVCLWVNLPTAGIIGASKFDFLLTAITNVLWAYKRNSIAIIVHPNRAAQLQSGNRTVFFQSPPLVPVNQFYCSSIFSLRQLTVAPLTSKNTWLSKHDILNNSGLSFQSRIHNPAGSRNARTRRMSQTMMSWGSGSKRTRRQRTARTRKMPKKKLTSETSDTTWRHFELILI